MNGYCVSPPITEAMVGAWPNSHDEFCDEWWVFDLRVPPDFSVVAFCNFLGTRIADYQDLDFEGACHLDEYLSKFSPPLVFGCNEYAYVVRRSELRDLMNRPYRLINSVWSSCRGKESLSSPTKT